jgi:hypothetical protein
LSARIGGRKEQREAAGARTTAVKNQGSSDHEGPDGRKEGIARRDGDVKEEREERQEIQETKKERKKEGKKDAHTDEDRREGEREKELTCEAARRACVCEGDDGREEDTERESERERKRSVYMY